MKGETRMRVAVIGLGDIARKAYLPVLSAWEGLELLFCSRNLNKVRELQGQYRVAKGTAELDELLDWRPEAALVLASTEAHFPLAHRLLAAGVDVFLEKPAAASSQEARQLAELADAGQRVLMVGFNRRYAPLHRRARELWDGRPVSLAVLQKHRSGGFHTDIAHHYRDELIHLVDLLRFYCGEGQPIITSQYEKDGRPAGMVSTVALAGGGIGSFLASMQAGGWEERYSLYGEGTSLAVEAFSRLVFSQGKERRVWEETYASSWQTTLKGRGFVDQIAHFLDCVRTRSQPETSGWEAVKSQELAEAMVAQLDAAD
jgi:virulence factor